MGCNEWMHNDNMWWFVRDANTLLDHWQEASWLAWAAPVALMLVTQVIVRQRQEEEAVQRACKEAQRVIEVAQHEEEGRAKEAALARWTAGPSKRLMRKMIPWKASAVMLIPEVEMASDSDSDITLGASQGKLQEYKDMWATAKEGNIPARYVTVSVPLFNRCCYTCTPYYSKYHMRSLVAPWTPLNFMHNDVWLSFALWITQLYEQVFAFKHKCVCLNFAWSHCVCTISYCTIY